MDQHHLLGDEGLAQARADQPPVLFLSGIFGLSGAVSGFLLSGSISLSLGVFVATALGLVLGWNARGVTKV